MKNTDKFDLWSSSVMTFFQATYHRCQNIWRIDWVDFGSHTFAFRTSCHSCFRHWHTLVERWVDNYFCKHNWWSPACRFHILDRSYNWAAYIDSTLKFKHRIIQWSYVYFNIILQNFETHFWISCLSQCKLLSCNYCQEWEIDNQGITNCVCKNNCRTIIWPACAVSIIGTHWSNDGLTIIFANTIGDPLLVDFTLLTVVTTEQLALIQP